MYYVYMVKCIDGTFYAGMTTELERRVAEHNSPNSDTKYTRTRQPVKLVYSVGVKNRSAALKLEARIKKSSRIEKIQMINKNNEFLKRSSPR